MAQHLRILRMDEVMDRVGLERSTIYLKISLGVFPRPVKLGNKGPKSPSRWLEHEIDEWIEGLMKRRDEGGI